MPRYIYHCGSCDDHFQIWHGMKEKQSSCTKCGEGEHLMRVPQIPTTRPPSSDGDSKTGRLTQEKIEENQQLLKEMKKEARNQTYDD